MLTHARKTHISGRARFVYNVKKYYIYSSGGAPIDDGIRLLVSRVVKGAMHNSRERFDAPTCHEGTRTAVQDDIIEWADELVNHSNELVIWMYGPASVGKSAVAQTIAQKLHARGQLTASFFFLRASGSGGRDVETDFVATLAHQLSLSVPATKQHIAAAVRENPLVFDLTLQDQVDTLIVAPLLAVSTSFDRHRVIVVDGLDECSEEHDAQNRVVEALIFGLSRIPHHSHKLFITSRPEDRIVSIFKKYEGTLLRKMVLDSDWNSDRNIRLPRTGSSISLPATTAPVPVGPVDPFVAVTATNVPSKNANNMVAEGFSQPALTSDDHIIVQALLSLTERSGRQGLSVHRKYEGTLTRKVELDKKQKFGRGVHPPRPSSYASRPRVGRYASPMTSLSVSSTRSQRTQAMAATFSSDTFQIATTTVHNRLSPERSNSLSPPPAENALSFDSFVPVGPSDPFATDATVTAATFNALAPDAYKNWVGLDDDDDVMRSLQSLYDSNGWQDIPLPGFNWMAQLFEPLNIVYG